MLNDNKKNDGAVSAKTQKPDAKRAPTESRRVERLDAFAARVNAPAQTVKVERRGRRKTTAEITVPQKQRT